MVLSSYEQSCYTVHFIETALCTFQSRLFKVDETSSIRVSRSLSYIFLPNNPNRSIGRSVTKGLKN